MIQAFISHSSRDQEWVEWIAHEIEGLGVRAYLAQHDPRAGEMLSEKVRREIANSDLVIVLLTVHGYYSAYVQQEIGVAIEQGKLIMPLVHPDLEGAPLAMLAGLEYIPFAFDGPPTWSQDLTTRVRDLAAQAERRNQEAELAARKQQLERIRDGMVAATIVLTALYLVTRSDGGAASLSMPGLLPS